MVETILLKYLREEDSPIFGGQNITLAKLLRAGLPVADGLVITPPHLVLQTVLKRADFASKEVIEQRLVLIKKELEKIKLPEKLLKDLSKYKKFYLEGQILSDPKMVWKKMLELWIYQLKSLLWRDGFNEGLTNSLNPVTVFFIEPESEIISYFDPEGKEVNLEGFSAEPTVLKEIDQQTIKANRRLILPHNYKWAVKGGQFWLIGVVPYTPKASPIWPEKLSAVNLNEPVKKTEVYSAVKVIYDLSTQGMVIDRAVDGVYLDSSLILNPYQIRQSYDEMVFKLIESAITFEQSPIYFKLADVKEKNSSVRGALRLIHQKGLLEPLLETVLFARNKKNCKNVHVVLPYLRSCLELEQLKREMAVKKLVRKSSFEVWIEVALPENIINLEEYLQSGIDGVVLNLDELISALLGFELDHEEVSFYKKEVKALIRFLEVPLKLLHKSRVKFIALGSICLETELLHFLVEKGVVAVVLKKYEVGSAKELLHSVEKRIVLSRAG